MISYPTLFAVASLIPAILVAPLVRLQTKVAASVIEFVNIYSVFAVTIAGLILCIQFIQYLDF